MDIELYINNKRVDLNDNVNINYTYQMEDIENPAAIKNSFTKSIVLDGTKTNNSIFNDIYKLDRSANLVGGYYIGTHFNPSQRTPFYIVKNGELLESGYMQLTEIIRKNNNIQYKINLYGGLGDFFYNLKYKNGEEESIKTLADIDYFEGGKDELNIKINKDTIYQSFNTDYSKPVKDKNGFICFIPAYNGKYENFENSKVLINCKDTIFPTSVQNDNGSYFYAKDNYIKCEVKNEMTEWDMRDLRSHKQRIGVKTNKLIESICDSRNNGGYDVKLDSLFFNDKNPYWNDTVITFPLQSTEESNNNYNVIMGDIYQTFPETPDFNTLGFYEKKHYSRSTFQIGITGEGLNYSGAYLDISDYPVNSNVSMSVPVKVLCKGVDKTQGELHIGFLKRDDDELLYDGWIDLQLVAYSDSIDMVGESRKIRLCGKTNAVVNDTDGYTDQQIIQGSFKLGKDGYVFTTNDGSNVLNFEFNNLRATGSKLHFYIDMECNKGITSYNSKYNLSTSYEAYGSTLKAGYFQLMMVDDTSFKFSYLDDVMSHTILTKHKLFKDENSCLDYLLSYCKLFNLSFIKDKYTNTIEIVTKNTLYKRNKVIDLTYKVDYNKDMSISPIIYDNKYYQLKYSDGDSYYLNKYKNDYGNDYGQKRVNTNYNFNLNTKEVFDGLLFNNVVDITDSSKYYRSYKTGTKPLPPFLLNDDIKLKYYGYDLSSLSYTDEYAVELAGTEYPINLNEIINWNSMRGNDNKVMPCFFGDDKGLSDITNTLLFYNGIKDMKDVNGNSITYTISDDLPSMMEDDEYSPCFLYTTTTTNVKGDVIAILTDKLPQYSRCYYSKSGNIVYSLDFGVPQEMYYQQKQSEENTLYHLFYKRIYTDKFNVNTKRLTCYVNLRGMVVDEDLFRNFYIIDGALFILNKITDYNINGTDTTKCEFIQVQDKDNYLNAQLGITMIRLLTNTQG